MEFSVFTVRSWHLILVHDGSCHKSEIFATGRRTRVHVDLCHYVCVHKSKRVKRNKISEFEGNYAVQIEVKALIPLNLFSLVPPLSA